MDLIVLAKEPTPGRVKTRLCPPCSPAAAATIAEAALADTLDAATRTGADRVLVALDGAPGDWLPVGARVVDQGRGDLSDRLSRAWSHAVGPALQIGMDTPQVTRSALVAAMDVTADAATDAVMGLALDGGWWALGMRSPRPDVFAGVPASTPTTGVRQLVVLQTLGFDVGLLPVQRDVDTWDDALAVAAVAPHTRFASAVARVCALAS